MARRLVPAAIAVSAWLVACGGGKTSPAPTPAPSHVTSAGGWVALAGSPLSPGTARHDDVFFLDEANGWLVNVRREAYRTQDAGTAWELLTRFTASRLAASGSRR